MKIAEADILIVPGLGNSTKGHWQRRWLEKMPTAQWVEQENWETPERGSWGESLLRAVMMATRPVVLVGHSLGVHTIVHASARLADTKVRGAFLVSPPDLEGINAGDRRMAGFTPLPTAPFSFPSMLVASANDPACSIERAGDLANFWGSDFHDAGNAGHINADSGHGPWPEGMMMFARFMQRLKA